MKRERDN